MNLKKMIGQLKLVTAKAYPGFEFDARLTKGDLLQELAWLEELQEYRDTGLTPEQVNLAEATLRKEQGLIARERNGDTNCGNCE